jgi:hypothetical protein
MIAVFVDNWSRQHLLWKPTRGRTFGESEAIALAADVASASV